MGLFIVFVVLWLTVLVLGIIVLIRIHRKKLFWPFKLTLLAVVFLLILLARMGVNLCASYNPEEESLARLNVWERILDSVVHTFQSFSADEDYTSYTLKGKELFTNFLSPAAATAYGTVASLLNVLAPLIGGAVLLEILSGVLPRLRLFFHPLRRKFVFSELNSASVTLAEDLFRNKQYLEIFAENGNNPIGRICKPLLIFAGGEEANSSEDTENLLSRAKALNAVCVKTDPAHLPLRHSKAVYYFLISEQEQKNVSAAAGLLPNDPQSSIPWPLSKVPTENRESPTKIFVFCQSDMSVSMIKRIWGASAKKDHVLVRPIRDYDNAAVNLMYRVPLFLPLLSGKKPTLSPNQETVPFGRFQACRDEKGRLGGLLPTRELHVTILGSGSIAEEAFLAAFWCGQIGGVQLHLHVLAREAVELKRRLSVKCPELLKVCSFRGVSAAPNPLLRVYPKSDSSLENPPYAVIDGFSKNNDVSFLDDYPEELLSRTDYLIVALGSDEMNIYVSTLLKEELSRLALKAGIPDRHPVIAPAVFDEHLADSVSTPVPGDYEPYLCPFGTLKERFSCRNVFLTDVTEDALKSENLYNSKNQANRQKDEYTYRANVARSVHAPYKLFALGCLTHVNLSGTSSPRFGGCDITNGPKQLSPEDDLCFAWMEHRRWAAFMRAQGFSLPDEQQHARYFEASGKHKDLNRKLHNCLVESSVIKKDMPKNVEWPGPVNQLSDYDALDLASIQACHMNCERDHTRETQDVRRNSEYKQYDCFREDEKAQKIMSDFKTVRTPPKTHQP